MNSNLGAFLKMNNSSNQTKKFHTKKKSKNRQKDVKKNEMTLIPPLVNNVTQQKLYFNTTFSPTARPAFDRRRHGCFQAATPTAAPAGPEISTAFADFAVTGGAVPR